MAPTIEELADDVRATVLRYQAELPVKIATLARELGVEVKSATLPPRVSGEIKRVSRNPDLYQIRVNRHEAPARQRYTIAHELAHYLLHRPLIGDGVTDNILYRSSLSDSIEAQANRLAANLLMPAPKVRDELKRLGGEVNDEVVETLAERFNVSESAMGLRVGRR